MTVLIAHELRETFIMFAAGMAVMLIFQTRDLITEMLKLRGRIQWFVYLLSWLSASFIFVEFLYAANYGMLRWYDIAVFAIAISLWKKYIYDIMLQTIGLSTNEKRYSENEEEKED